MNENTSVHTMELCEQPINHLLISARTHTYTDTHTHTLSHTHTHTQTQTHTHTHTKTHTSPAYHNQVHTYTTLEFPTEPAIQTSPVRVSCSNRRLELLMVLRYIQNHSAQPFHKQVFHRDLCQHCSHGRCFN